MKLSKKNLWGKLEKMVDDLREEGLDIADFSVDVQSHHQSEPNQYSETKPIIAGVSSSGYSIPKEREVTNVEGGIYA